MTRSHQDYIIEQLIAEVRSLRIRLDTLEAEREGERSEGEAIAEERNGNAETDGEFSVGDRIRITNKVRKPATWSKSVAWSEETERKGTVTRIIGDQVHFVTDNGTNTWRAQNNIKKI